MLARSITGPAWWPLGQRAKKKPSRRSDADQVDRAIDGYRLATIPALCELDGFCSCSLLADRDSGFGVASVTFDSVDALRRSRAATDAMKAATVRDSGAEIVDECEFDLVLAHLRVPEMA